MDQVSDYDYELPPELIAQAPLPDRSASRMLVVSRDSQTFRDDMVSNVSQRIRPGDCLVLNNTRVFPARLHGRRNNVSGAEVEVFLLRAQNAKEDVWKVLVRPAKRVRVGDQIILAENLRAQVIFEGEFGERTMQFYAKEGLGHLALRDLFEELGQTPLPPYIHREPDRFDRERYQTVFARQSGSVAAPTAGLHFTPEMLTACRTAGASIAEVTLHVGLGTFAPLRHKRVAEIELHEEYFEMPAEGADQMKHSSRLVCVGTTSVRTVETAMLRGGLKEMTGETNLFISPGFKFQAAGAILTNFHLPQSSLLMLVCAFAGHELTLAAYRHAVREKYRFFSYGDCMFIE